MKVYIKREGFEYIEMRSPYGGVTIKEFANKFGIKEHSAATWLSHWKGKGFLKRGGGWREQSRYYIDNTCIWWGVKVFDSEKGFV